MPKMYSPSWCKNVLTTTEPQTNPLHGGQYKAENGNLRKSSVIVHFLCVIFFPLEPAVQGYGVPPGLAALGRILHPWRKISG